MNTAAIDRQMQTYVDNAELSGCALIVRQRGQLVYQNTWGFANLKSGTPITYNSIYRMMSMTKCITAAGILKLMDSGELSIDDPILRFIPEFKDMRVSCDSRYVYRDGMGMISLLPKLLLFNMRRVHTEPAVRQITIRDLLSHSSGLEQGVVGLIAMMKDKRIRETLTQQAEKYARYALDFHPGTGTGYSPIAGFDMLTLVIERITGANAEEYLRSALFEPLDMKDTTFFLREEQRSRLVSVYKRKKNTLVDVTNTNEDMDGMLHRGPGYIAGSGGLYSTITDYEHFAQMLCNEGTYGGKQILKPETVELMHTEAPARHLEPEPGYVWGLGVKIRQNREKGQYAPTDGTYGWSGAFGTHFFVSPKDKLDCVFATNRTDLNGSGSYISKRLEELVFML